MFHLCTIRDLIDLAPYYTKGRDSLNILYLCVIEYFLSPFFVLIKNKLKTFQMSFKTLIILRQ